MSDHDERNPPDDDEKKERKYVDCADYVASFTPPDYLIDRLLRTGNVYALTAMTGHMKTAWATLAALSVACGVPFGGLEVQKCPVLLLSGENDDDQKARTIATMSEYGLAPEPGYFRVLSGPEAIGILKDDIPRETKALGKFGLVVADTSISYFGGDEENSNVEMQAHAAMFRELGVNLGGATVLVLCHPTKAPGKDNLLPRGGGSFLAEIDGNLTLWKKGELVTLSWQGKFRGSTFEPMEYQVKPVVLDGYKDSKGRPVHSVVIRPLSEAEFTQVQRQEWTDENKVLYELLRHADSSISDICKECNWVGPTGVPNKAKVHSIFMELFAQGLAEKLRTGKWALTIKGRKEAESID